LQIIKQLRRRNGINQTDLAAAIGVSLRTIQLYEKKDANIPIKNLTQIADFFKMSIAELYLQEVNEEESNYNAKKIKSAGGNVGHALPNGKYLVMAPVLLSNFHEQFLQELHLDNPITTGFVVDDFDDGGYMAFEIIGNAMNNGSIQSIPNGALVLGKLVATESLLGNSKNELLHTPLVFICNTRIICKQFTGYNDSKKSIRCSSLNSSPEYSDFEIELTDIRKVYKVVKKQL